jgi:alpha-galactosidase
VWRWLTTHVTTRRYVNIDAGSMEKNRTAEGKIQEDRAKFPRGIRYISDQLHAKGLKLGVYTDLSNHGCGTGPGSMGHYTLDAQVFAHDWQADYLKVDFVRHQPCRVAAAA